MMEKKGLMIDKLNKQYFNLSLGVLDIDMSKNQSVTITMSLKICEKMLVSIINTAESYKQAFTEIAEKMSRVEIDDNVSLS
jgi:hypothetical protein